MVVCPFWVGEETLPQVEDFKHLWFKSEAKMEPEVARQTDAVVVQVRYGEEGAEPKREALNVRVDPRSYPQLLP